MSHQRVKNMCRFTKELDEKLIELVSKNDVLYNVSHAYYKDIGHRDDVWQAISSMVGKSVQDCKTRWRSLRDLYHRKRNDEKRGLRKRRHVWEYMDALSFLDEKKTSSADQTSDTDNTEDIKLDISENNLKSEPSDDATSPPNKKFKIEPNLTNENSVLDLTSSKHSVISSTYCQTTLQLLAEIRNAINNKQHPIMTFFDSMAKTVMTFPPALAAEAKLKVCQIVTEIECRILEETGDYPENLSSFS